MNLSELRALLYPIGFFASTLFSLRFWLQWIQSERQKKSVVGRSFWLLSIGGNFLLALHGLIQLHYPTALLQTLNGVIALRNLELLKEQKRHLVRTLLRMGVAAALLTLLFAAQSLFGESASWIRSPKGVSVGWGWHLLGVSGLTLFASRFWVQWWQAERLQKSVLGKSFWACSLVGGVTAVVYFAHLRDPVNILCYGSGLLPYARNLFLLMRPRKERTFSPALFFIAGEQSGDLLGSELLKALPKDRPYYGVGGSQMKQQGLKQIASIDELHVMGLVDVVRALPRLFGLFRRVAKAILTENPRAVIFIDYPDFNMWLAAHLRARGYRGRLLHYVSPSVWAWRRGRVKRLARTLDHLLTIFPFEATYYAQTALPVTYVGHPLVRALEEYPYAANWRTRRGIPEDSPLLSLFPGSRQAELRENVPVQMASARELVRRDPRFVVAISCARPELEPLLRALLCEYDLPYLVVQSEERYEQMRESTCALATSGTVTLELALHEVATLVTYHVKRIHRLARHLFRVYLPHYCIVNVIAGREVYPEFILKRLEPEECVDRLEQLMKGGYRSDCAAVRAQLTSSVPTAASILSSYLEK